MTFKQFVYITRPHTLPASIAPVSVAIALAWLDGCTNWLVASLCLIVGASAQAFSNCCNDYYDYVRASDSRDRPGFERPLTTGALSPGEVMRVGLFWACSAAIAGIVLCCLTSPRLLLLGGIILLCAWLYTGGRHPLSYIGLGDVAVLVFYGWVGVLTTYYLLTGRVTMQSFIVATAMGLSAVNILVVNNYRDYQDDLRANKRTTIVRYGLEFAPRLYLANILCALLLSMISFRGNIWGILLLLPYLTYAMTIYRQLLARSGSELNGVLKRTALGVVFLALVHISACLIQGLLL